jgi:hypothetical protein
MQNKIKQSADEIIDEGIHIVNSLNKKFVELQEEGKIDKDTAQSIEALIQGLTSFILNVSDMLYKAEDTEEEANTQNEGLFTEKQLEMWSQAVKKFNEAETPEEEIEALKGLLRVGKRLGIPEELIFARVVKVLSEQVENE